MNACGTEHFRRHEASWARADDGDLFVGICSHRLSVGGLDVQGLFQSVAVHHTLAGGITVANGVVVMGDNFYSGRVLVRMRRHAA